MLPNSWATLFLREQPAQAPAVTRAVRGLVAGWEGRALPKVILRRLNALATAVVFVIAALLCSQVSEFIQHYTQNLAGRLDEARREVNGIIVRADAADMPVYAYLNEFTSATNPVFRQQGVALRATIDRASGLEQAYSDIVGAGIIDRPFVFAMHVRRDIATDVFRHFKPAVPLHVAGLLYALMGGVLGVVLYAIVKSLCVLPLRAARFAKSRRTA